jgi:hypothetical protein
MTASNPGGPTIECLLPIYHGSMLEARKLNIPWSFGNGFVIEAGHDLWRQLGVDILL